MLPNDYEKTLELIIRKIKKTQQKAIISTNYYLIKLYWEIRKNNTRKEKSRRMGKKCNRKNFYRLNKRISKYKRIFSTKLKKYETVRRKLWR